jgi:cobalt-zinc-cadmium resistance protein CzcA
VTVIVDGAMEPLRSVLLTGLVAFLGFLPMALATETGEAQGLLATVMIGGFVTVTALMLLVLPAIMLSAGRF